MKRSRRLHTTSVAHDILTEMVCLIYADGDEEKYRHTLEALKYRQKEGESRIINPMNQDDKSSTS